MGQKIVFKNTGSRYFPSNLMHAKWVDFEAAGYQMPVTGVIYRGDPRPTCGMPLGGIDTGCIDIDPNGLIGFCTIFNHLIDPRLIINLPFLGLACDGKATLLATDDLAKAYAPVKNTNIKLVPPTDYTPKYHKLGIKGVELADAIDYWGHFPILDMEYTTQAPVSVDVRAWSPFIPGDVVTSLATGAVFELTVRNPDSATHQVSLAFSFPGFELSSAPDARLAVRRTPVNNPAAGIVVESGQKGNAWEMAYALTVLDQAAIRTGGPLNADGKAWAAIAKKLPQPAVGETGASLALDFELAAGESKTCRILFAWHAPHWNASGAPSHRLGDIHTGPWWVERDLSGGIPPEEESDLHTHMYAKHYPDVQSVVAFLAKNHAKLLKRIIAWHEVIFNDKDTPGWLADALINIMHLIPEDSVWGQAKPPIKEWCRPEDGLFGLSECPRGCPQIECMPCSFYGNIPVVYFFPEAALSTLRGYKGYQFEDGRAPWIFGGCTASVKDNRPPYGIARPDKGYQTVLNGACYIDMFDRYWRTTGDNAVLAEFWDSLKRANDFHLNLRPEYGMSQVVAMPTGNVGTEWFEAPEPGWKGYVTHAGAIRMAQVMEMRRMAEVMNDAAYVKKCNAWLEAGAKALEEHLWNGSYYINFNEPETGEKSELVFGYNLDGQWMTDWHGLPGVFPKKRVDQTLDMIRKVNCALSQSGAVDYANADGTEAKVGGYGTYSYFPPEVYMLAMTYMYEGQKEFGTELLYKCLENQMKWGYVWDAINLVRGDVDTGQNAYGTDYYQDMMLWAAPSAIKGMDIAQTCQSGGLIKRVIAAGKV